MSSDNGMMNGDEYHDGDGNVKVCRDFMRNVCNRGKSCKFIHPQDIKIRTEPIFCHDFQQSKCFRSTCKFIHCSREEEEHYKNTGELPQGYLGCEISSYGTVVRQPGGTGPGPARQNGTLNATGRGGGGGVGGGVGRGGVANNPRTSWGTDSWNDNEDVPVCKDFLKGQCDRPPGSCKFRHIDSRGGLPGASLVSRRRPAGGTFYDAGPEAKRSLGYTTTMEPHLTEYDDYYNTEYVNPPPPPPQQQQQQMGYPTPTNVPQGNFGLNEISFGRNGFGQNLVDSAAVQSYASASIQSPAMKALEDENFMLKRRIEELKKQVTDLTATNEYLLSQNAHFRLTKDSNTTASVVQTLVSMSQSQPLGMTMTTPLNSLPSVSMSSLSSSMSQGQMPVVSMSHPVSLAGPQSVYPMVTTQGVLPPN